MPVIYCYINPFVMEQNIYEGSEGTSELVYKGKITLDKLPEFFTNAWNEGNKLVIHSASEELSKGYAEEIKNYGLTKYNLNNLEIEVE